LTVAEIADRLDGELIGDGKGRIKAIAGIQEAGEGDLTFLANRRYAEQLSRSRATAVLVPRSWNEQPGRTVIKVDDPEKAFVEIVGLFAPAAITYPPGIHETAIVSDEAAIGEAVSIGPYCVVRPGATIGARGVLTAFCYVGDQTTIGEDGLLYPFVSIRERVRIGTRVIIHNGSVIGSDGFGYTADEQGVRTKIPQIGTVEIGDDVEIGAGVTVDRARFGVTRIGDGVKIDNLVQVAHNVVIGDHAVIVAQAGIAGSSEIGSKAILAGQAGISGHMRVGEGAIVGAQGGVTKDVPPGVFVSGYPAMPHRQATKLQAHVGKLPELKKRVDELEKRLQQLEGK